MLHSARPGYNFEEPYAAHKASTRTHPATHPMTKRETPEHCNNMVYMAKISEANRLISCKVIDKI